jgi:hypothetical protein
MYNSNYGNRGLPAYGQQQVRPMNLNRQSPALQTPLPELKPPVGARGQDIMIIWDFQVSIKCPPASFCSSCSSLVQLTALHLYDGMAAECENTYGVRAYRCDQVGWVGSEERQTVVGGHWHQQMQLASPRYPLY